MLTWHIPDYNINIINCNEFFADCISDEILDSLFDLNLMGNKITTGHSKKLFFHHTIHKLCDKILEGSGTSSRNILFFNNTQLKDCAILKFFAETDIIHMIQRILDKISKVLPVRVYISRYSATYIQHLLGKHDARGSMVLNQMRSLISKDFSSFSFSNAKKFAEKFELKWLNTEYFNRISTKLLLIK